MLEIPEVQGQYIPFHILGDEVNRWSILFEAVIWRWLIQGTIQPVLAVIVGLIGCPLVSLGVMTCK